MTQQKHHLPQYKPNDIRGKLGDAAGAGVGLEMQEQLPGGVAGSTQPSRAVPITCTPLPAVLRVQHPVPQHQIQVCATPLGGFVTHPRQGMGAPPAQVTVALATAGLPRFSDP